MKFLEGATVTPLVGYQRIKWTHAAFIGLNPRFLNNIITLARCHSDLICDIGHRVQPETHDIK